MQTLLKSEITNKSYEKECFTYYSCNLHVMITKSLSNEDPTAGCGMVITEFSEDPENPQTKDSSDMLLWILLLIFGSAVLTVAALIYKGKGKKRYH